MKRPSAVIAVAILLLALGAGSGAAAGGYGYLTSIGSGADAIDVLYVGGSHYDMGYWHGSLLASKVQANVASALAAAQSQWGVTEQQWQTAIAAMWPHVPTAYMDEMQGLADGSGVAIGDIYKMHALGDIAEYNCSAFAALGPATVGGHCIQLRNLDFDMGLGVQDNPLLIVYDLPGPKRYVTISFAGSCGVIAGMSNDHLPISEMGDNFGPQHETLDGEPMPFVLRDILEHASSYTEAENIVRNASRTSSLWYTVSDPEEGQAGLMQTAMDIFNVWHLGEPPGGVLPALPSVIYGGQYNDRLYNDLSTNWGNIDPTVAQAISVNNAMSSNLMNAVYDATTLEMWVAYAEDLDRAANRPFVYFNLNDLTCTYDDVSMLFWAYRYIEAVTREGIATGCSGDPPLFCPTGQVTRGQMAVFLCKAAGKTWLNKSSATFTDVPRGSNGQWDGGGSGGLDADGTHIFYGWIERLADPASWGGEAPTGGCGSGRFCPSAAATRGQMAAFLCKAGGKSWLDRPTPTFTDVPRPHPFYGWVERLADAGSWDGGAVTTGCNAGMYCPGSAVPRGQMAVFLCRAFAIPY
jgi:hypothetical protein